MSTERQTPEWRDFEQLVALIESHLGPAGAVVRSPDRILDGVTGQPREVDASVRYQVGSVPVLITIECRDRESAQDVRWIEELIAKRDSIGASATVAVSASGFSRPAIEKALPLGLSRSLVCPPSRLTNPAPGSDEAAESRITSSSGSSSSPSRRGRGAVPPRWHRISGSWVPRRNLLSRHELELASQRDEFDASTVRYSERDANSLRKAIP